MNNLKRLFICALCLIGLSMPTFSKTIEAYGYASTPQEAQEAAQKKLTEQVFGTIVQNVTTVSVKDTGTKSSETYSTSYNASSFGMLYGVEYSSLKKIDKSTYEVRAYIDDSNAILYVDGLNKVCEKISNVYYNNESSIADKKDKLIELLSLITQYENLKQVLIAMNHLDEIPAMPIEENYQSISTQLDSVYTELMNEQEKKRETTIDASAIDSIIEGLRIEQEAFTSSSEKALLEQRAMYEASIKESIQSVIASNQTVETKAVEGFSLQKDIEALNSVIAAYNRACYLMDRQIKSITEKNNNEISIGVK